MIFAVIGPLVAILLFDLWLELSGRPTISEWYQAQFPTWIDLVLLGIWLFVLYIADLPKALIVILAALFGHLFWPNKERWGRGH